MSIVKSYSVGAGDMFYVRHNSDNFTIIDCDLSEENAEAIIEDIKAAKEGKGIERFICTHPDEDHFGGLHLLDDANFDLQLYVVKNQAVKDVDTDSGSSRSPAAREYLAAWSSDRRSRCLKLKRARRSMGKRIRTCHQHSGACHGCLRGTSDVEIF